MSIQPLVENAVYHGIQPLPDGGLIQVNGYVEGQYWYLMISNPVANRKASDPGRGSQIAVNNIRQRLDYRYEGRATMVIEHDDSKYCVTLKVPLTSKQTEPS